jgi:hypothetical protein
MGYLLSSEKINFDNKIIFIRGEGLIPRPSGAVIKVLNPRPIPLEINNPAALRRGC